MSEFIPYSENSGLNSPESIINLECYEPNSGRICMDARDLCQHTLIVGSTGSGKTTGLMQPMIQNLIEYKASDPVHKLGLVIYDSFSRGGGLFGKSTVPRHEFVPADQRGRAYADSALPIGAGQTVSLFNASVTNPLTLATDFINIAAQITIKKVN